MAARLLSRHLFLPDDTYATSHRWTEPIILLLIVFNAVVLTIQAARGIAPVDDNSHLQQRGYFQAWEDYALFALFVVFT